MSAFTPPLRRSSPPERGLIAVFVVVISFISVACTSEPPDEISAETYRVQLATVCTNAAAARQGLVEPVDSSEVATFASEVAALVDEEAEQARALTAPGELDGDHRAFVQNTAEQASRWNSLAVTSPDDVATFGGLQTEILELTLGRDDLAVEMGVEACLRSAS